MSAAAMLAVEARSALGGLYAALRASGCAAPAEADGQMIRPLLSLAGARALGAAPTPAFWSAAAAVQLAHEASLVHDDVIDNAAVRRARPTLAAEHGVAAALVEGDHLLATSYRLAATASPQFFEVFTHAVERTVAGEKLQGRTSGQQLDERAYRSIVGGKSGELLGCALACAPLAAGDARAARYYAVGRRIGILYQMLDDLLDYCEVADTGKAPLADYRQGRWTWPLLELAGVTPGGDGNAAADVALQFARRDRTGTSPASRCMARLRAEARAVSAAIAAHIADGGLLDEVIASWIERAATAVDLAETAAAARETRSLLESRVPRADAMDDFFQRNSRSFSFAARLFPREFRERVTGVYAFCRVTDDIADGDLPAESRLECLALWERLAAQAHAGEPTGVLLLDTVMADAARNNVPFAYVSALIDGMRMDLHGETYGSVDELRVYSYRVAGVVGQWLTRLCGVHEDAVLERAASLGHAMQLTNILRDVGEDLRNGRVYLPAEVMRAHGVTIEHLQSFAAGAPVSVEYRTMIEALMQRAETDYALALEAVPSLPPFFRRAVAVAAWVYRGIHDVLRANDCDNFRARAVTTTSAKLGMAARALAVPRLDSVAAAARATRAALFALILTIVAAAFASLGAQTVNEAQLHQRAVARVAQAPADAGAHLDLARATYFVAVTREPAVAEGHATLAAISAADSAFATRHEALLMAYSGAFTTLEAKHGSWPPSRLLAVRRGLQKLDAAVDLAPADAEVRYLRLVSTHYLPGLFGRKESARTDMAALTRLLDDNASALPHPLYRTMARFVLENGRPGRATAERLRRAIGDPASSPASDR